MGIEKRKKTSVFLPKLILSDVTKITPELLKNNGIKGLVLDVDNTLTSHGSQKISPNIKIWLENMKKSNIPMIIVSNNTKDRITPFANLLGLPFISMGMKPLVRGFVAAQKHLNIRAGELAIAGDQIFTDVWGGNRAKMFTILVTPMSVEKSFTFKLRRRLERRYIKKYKLLFNKENI